MLPSIWPTIRHSYSYGTTADVGTPPQIPRAFFLVPSPIVAVSFGLDPNFRTKVGMLGPAIAIAALVELRYNVFWDFNPLPSPPFTPSCLRPDSIRPCAFGNQERESAKSREAGSPVVKTAPRTARRRSAGRGRKMRRMKGDRRIADQNAARLQAQTASKARSIRTGIEIRVSVSVSRDGQNSELSIAMQACKEQENGGTTAPLTPALASRRVVLRVKGPVVSMISPSPEQS